MDKKYESEALMVSHQSAECLFRLGVIKADEMRDFDNMCLDQEGEGAVKPAKTVTPAPGF